MKLKFRVNEEGKKQIIVEIGSEREKSNEMFDPEFGDRDFLMVGDFRYFGIERFNYKRRYAI